MSNGADTVDDEVAVAEARVARAARALAHSRSTLKAATFRNSLDEIETAKQLERVDLAEVRDAEVALSATRRAVVQKEADNQADGIFNAITGFVGREVARLLAESAESSESHEWPGFPLHEWDGTRLRFETAPGVWGEWIQLRGPKGEQGKRGQAGYSGGIAELPAVIGGGGAFDGVTAIGGGGADFDPPAVFGGGGAAEFEALVINGSVA